MSEVLDLDDLIKQLTKIRKEHGNLAILNQEFSGCMYDYSSVKLDIGYKYMIDDPFNRIFSQVLFKSPSNPPPFRNDNNFVDNFGKNVDESKTVKCLVFRSDC